MRKALEQLIQRRWDRAAGGNIEDILQGRQRGLELLIHSLQRELLLYRGIGVSAACVVRLLNSASNPVLS